MFIRNCWYVAGWDHELLDGELFAVTIINEPLVLYRTHAGNVVAMEDRCCHRSAPLSRGRIEDGCNLRCMYHGLKFDERGTCIEIPGQDNIPCAARVQTYPVVTRHSWLWVWMGDASQADPSLIPSAMGLDVEDWILRPGQMDYQANYLLINDNLTDFSHLSYVHAASFKVTEVVARTRPLIVKLDRGIRVSRWSPSSELREGDSIDKGRAETAEWATYDYLAPGVLLMLSEVHPLSAMPADRSSLPTTAPLSSSFTSQAVTPLTDQTSRYFFSWGPNRHTGGSDEMADEMAALARMAFTEDREMIEAQQRVINLKPGKELLTSADVGPVQMRNVIRQLLEVDNVNESTSV